jgi:hypothetical protein
VTPPTQFTGVTDVSVSPELPVKSAKATDEHQIGLLKVTRNVPVPQETVPEYVGREGSVNGITVFDVLLFPHLSSINVPVTVYGPPFRGGEYVSTACVVSELVEQPTPDADIIGTEAGLPPAIEKLAGIMSEQLTGSSNVITI